MSNILIVAVLFIIICILLYILYKLRKISKSIRKVYELPHGESLYSINHHEFNSLCLQYVLIIVRTIMQNWMEACVESENYEAAEAWKQSVNEVEKLIKLKINK